MAGYSSVLSDQDSPTTTCALCDSQDNVNWYCNDCQDALCDRCKAAHTRGRKTRNDIVVSIGDANRQEDKPVPEVCKLHPGELCDMYCCDCDTLMCLMCFEQTHKQHNWKRFEDEFTARKQRLKEQMASLSAIIAHSENQRSEQHRANQSVIDNLDNNSVEVNFQRTKIKAEIDSIADAVLAELSSLEEEESAMHEKYCEKSEKKVEELTQLLEKMEMLNTSNVSRLEIDKLVSTTLTSCDEDEDVLPKLPNFVSGDVDHDNLRKMVGEFIP
ncbi:transcription intermediary factor 1-beta-like [Mizuhopecten yessoensis]|uniref:Transcription intermediary factor 1-beta n=1 Tax=Mizuhopecten yessoensis TaxID=6573 RepID=A0A210PGP6_MIZYE|nr:transcription intermediary factor 1-beta-like [Mizuhopecten yessoensis]OWF35672.1 Transcription intermediary factor 1-beta [Mizuhopecten yessoensis]